MAVEAAVVLLHLLVFVYWLGGDLGAFYASRWLTRPGVSAKERLFAARIVGDVDMAPRTALILTVPTGLWAADTRGWLELPDPVLALVIALGLGWLALAWVIHLRHVGPGTLLRRIDLMIRWLVLFGALGAGGAGLAGLLALPQFLAIKLVLFAAAVALGLLVRATLAPLGAALGALAGPDPAPGEAMVAKLLARARPQVVAIWIVITTAALLGLWRPT